MENSNPLLSRCTISYTDTSIRSFSSHFPLLMSFLSEDCQSWIPEEILSLPCNLSEANKKLLFRKYGITELHWASLTNSMSYAGDLLNRGEDVHKTTRCDIRRPRVHNSEEIQGVTALFLAARSGHSALVELLLEHGAVDDILKVGTKGDSALHAAALSGDASVIKLLLNALSFTPQRKGAADKMGYEARTPLHYAAGKGHTACVDALLEADANASARDKYGATPFHFAAGWGNSIPCIDLLMRFSRQQHVDEAADNKGWTALHYAAEQGQLRTVRWLLEKGASINAVDTLNANTPLHLAARHPDVICVLTARGADVWLKNDNEEYAIGLAHNQKNALAVKAHISAIQSERNRDNMNPFAKHGKDNATLLHYMSAYGTAEDLTWFMGLSAFQEETTPASSVVGDSNIDVTDKAGRTAVHWAAIAGNVDALRILAEHKADLTAKDKEGRTILCLAISYSHAGMDFVHAFLALPAVKLRMEKWVTHDEAMRWMKEYYIIHNLQPLMVFKRRWLRKTRAIIQHFITESSNWLSATFTSLGQVQVCRHRRLACCSSFKDALLGNCCSAPAYNSLDDLPPIYLALHANREDIAKFMQERIKGSAWQDAMVNRRGEETHRTALHWATILGKSNIVSKLCRDKLFSKSLKPNVEDKYGKTPLQYATELNQPAIEKLLMERKDVKNHLASLYRDRQVYVDAANAVLVVAALIASVTFAGWLQPPLNYVAYYNMPLPGTSDSAYEAYAAVQQHVGVRVFWGFNSLSFTFAIATVLAGLVGIVPLPRRYIATTVVHLRRTLWVASTTLALSIVFVLGAFAAAGFTVLPPVFKYQINMLGTIIVGGIPCILLLAWFVGILCLDREWAPSHSLSGPSHPPPPPQPPVRKRSRGWEK